MTTEHTVNFLCNIIEQEGAHTDKAQSAADMLKQLFNHHQVQQRLNMRERYKMKSIEYSCQACYGSGWNEEGAVCRKCRSASKRTATLSNPTT